MFYEELQTLHKQKLRDVVYIYKSKKPMRDQRISSFVLTLKIKLIAIVRFDTYNFHKNGYFQLKYIAIFKASLLYITTNSIH